MRDADPAIVSHLQSRAGVVPRSFLWMVGKNRATGEPEAAGFWSDLDAITVTVIDGLTGTPVSRDYVGSGTLISVDPVPLVSDLTVRHIRIRLSQVSAEVAQAIRGYDPRLAHVEIHLGLFDPATRTLIAPPVPQFVGQVNGAPIRTPAVGQEGDITLVVASQTRELTRTNPAKRSDETQRRRGGDRFRRYKDVAGQWEFFWGEKSGRIAQRRSGGGGALG
ncbi:MAG: hypothetical protein ABJG86_09695 [Nitratireductor sp.]